MPYVACRCYDSAIQRDQAGRRIPHEFLLLCTDEEYNLINRLAWGSLIIEQVRTLYAERYSCCTNDVTDCLIDFSICLDSEIKVGDSCMLLNVFVPPPISQTDLETHSSRRRFVKLSLLSLFLICLGVGYISQHSICGMNDEYVPILSGNGNNVSIGRAPVTAAEWAKFTGKTISSDRLRHPVTNISVVDVGRYCAWLMQNDPDHIYRLPTEEEWEATVCHLSKDVEFNGGAGDGQVGKCVTAKVDCGGVDFWDACWELTSTERGEGIVVVKGGMFNLKHAECHAEVRSETRKPTERCGNVTFRVVRQDKINKGRKILVD